MHHSGNNSPNITNQMTYGMTPEQASREFDILRRGATKLERHLEDRVARYQQVSFICILQYIMCIFFVIVARLRMGLLLNHKD